MKNQNTAHAYVVAAPAVSFKVTRKASAIVALVFGGLMVFGVGFSHSSTLHDAAHDARHAFMFPCH